MYYVTIQIGDTWKYLKPNLDLTDELSKAAKFDLNKANALASQLSGKVHKFVGSEM